MIRLLIILLCCSFGANVLALEVTSFSPSSEASLVSPEAVIEVVFDAEMNQSTVENSFVLKAIYDNQLLAKDDVVSGTFSWPTGRAFRFTPSSSLNKGYTFQVRISTEAEDLAETKLATDEVWNFRIIFDHAEENIFMSADNKAKVSLAESALTQDGGVSINRDPLHSPTEVNLSSITTANGKIYVLGDPSHYPIAASFTEFNAYASSGAHLTADFSASVSVTLYYDDVDLDGYVDDTFPAINESSLQICYLDETALEWVSIEASTVNPNLNYVTAPVDHFTLFALIPTLAIPFSSDDLSQAYAFPVPFRADAGQTKITFTNLSSECIITIYTIDGQPVAALNETNGDGIYEWDVTNNNGAALAAGVYIYHIKSDQDTKSGKIVIIR